MTRRLLNRQRVPTTSTSLIVSFLAANADGEEINNDQHTFLYVKNTNMVSARQGTVSHPQQVDGLDVDPYIFTIPAGSEVITRVFPSSFNQPGTSRVYIDWDDETDLSVAAITARRF